MEFRAEFFNFLTSFAQTDPYITDGPGSHALVRSLPQLLEKVGHPMKRGQKMCMFRSLFALFGLLAAITLVRTARAAEADFNGRWDIEVLAKAADIQFTTTKAWWLGITGAGTPEMKIQFVGSPDGSLDDITEAKVEGNVLHFTWTPRVRPGVTPNPNDHLEYEAKYVNGVLQGKMTGSQGEVAFTGRRAPEINEHDDGTWIKR